MLAFGDLIKLFLKFQFYCSDFRIDASTTGYKSWKIRTHNGLTTGKG